MIALPRFGSGGEGHGALVPLATGLTAAAVAELLILRTFTRTAIHIPAIEAMARPFEVISTAGRFAFFVAIVLLLVALPALALALWRSGAGQRIGALAIAVFLAGAAAARLGAPEVLTGAAILGAIGLLAGVIAARTGGRAGIPWLVFSAATIAAGGHILLQQPGVPVRGSASAVETLLTSAEYLGLAFAILLPLATGLLPGRRGLAIASAAGALTFAGMLGAPTVRILLLWNQGFSGSLPAFAYAIAAAALVAAAVTLGSRGQRLAVAGLLLIAAGGLGLQSTYQSALVVAGLALFALERAPLTRRRAG